MWILLILQNFAPWFSNLWTSNWTTMILFRVSYIDFQPFLQNIVLQNQLSLVFFKFWWFCTKVYAQRKIINLFWYPYFLLCTPKEVDNFAHTFTYKSHKVKENVQFYTRYHKRLLILYYAYTFVPNHQSLK